MDGWMDGWTDGWMDRRVYCLVAGWLADWFSCKQTNLSGKSLAYTISVNVQE
jgi:hypothetical protein